MTLYYATSRRRRVPWRWIAVGLLLALSVTPVVFNLPPGKLACIYGGGELGVFWFAWEIWQGDGRPGLEWGTLPVGFP